MQHTKIWTNHLPPKSAAGSRSARLVAAETAASRELRSLI
jgi:hypothetical protein